MWVAKAAKKAIVPGEIYGFIHKVSWPQMKFLGKESALVIIRPAVRKLVSCFGKKIHTLEEKGTPGNGRLGLNFPLDFLAILKI